MRFWLLLVIVFIVAGIAGRLVHRARKPRVGNVGPYRTIRRQFLKHAAEFSSEKKTPPVRPPDLDRRLPLTKLEELRRLFPYTDETWPVFHSCYCEIVDSIREELEAIDSETYRFELLTPGRRAIVLAADLEMEVNNGGFDQYFLNSSGDGAALAPDSLRLLGQESIAQMVERANSQFPGGPPSDRELRLNLMDKLGDAASKVWSELDGEYFDHEIRMSNGLVAGPGVAYILSNESEFFLPP